MCCLLFSLYSSSNHYEIVVFYPRATDGNQESVKGLRMLSIFPTDVISDRHDNVIAD